MFQIKRDDLSGVPVIELLKEHLADMQATSPPESKHALDLTELKSARVKFWSIWHNNDLAGCGAYQKIDDRHVEIKSMRTAANFRNRGVASLLLEHLIIDAKKNGYQQISLETGSMDYFKAARRLYEKHGFTYCPPFSNYVEDLNSEFMTLKL